MRAHRGLARVLLDFFFLGSLCPLKLPPQISLLGQTHWTLLLLSTEARSSVHFGRGRSSIAAEFGLRSAGSRPVHFK